MRRILTARRDDERGVALVMVALLLLALIGMVGLAVDGGAMFSDHRQTQNGADAAALAGTDALNKALATAGAVGHEGETYDAVYKSIGTNRTSSGSTQASGTGFTCQIIDQYQTPLGTCPTANNDLGLPASSDGVLVTLSDTRQTNFVQAVGPSSFTVRNHAAALIESYTPASGISPFMICAVGANDSRAGTQSTNFPTTPILQLNSSAINPAAIGLSYPLEANGAPDCGVTNNASFKGDTSGGAHPLPGTWTASTGRSGFQTGLRIAGGSSCSTASPPCLVLVPLCYSDHAGGWACQRMALFNLTAITSNSADGTLMSGGVVSGGQGGGMPGATDLRLIKLVQ